DVADHAPGKRPWKSRMRTSSGWIAIRTQLWNVCLCAAKNCSPPISPRYRYAILTYSANGNGSDTNCTDAVPLTVSHSYGQSTLSMLTATCGRSASIFILGEFGGAPMRMSWPVQWNHIGTTRGVPSRHV